jgi:F-type H+-transporting ATPase subunit delta
MSIALASRYARALADVAFDPKNGVAPETLGQDLDRVIAAVDSSRPLRDILASPAVAPRKKRAVIARIGEQLAIHGLTSRVLCVVLDHGRTGLLKPIREGYRRAVDERQGVVPATIISAVELTSGEREMFEQQVRALTGKQPRCEFHVDAGIVGGAILRVGSIVHDGSVRGRLKSLEAHLTREA